MPGKVFKMSERKYHAHCDENGGYCTACGAEAFGVEPDARKYECESCGERAVYGLEELLMMGNVEIK